MALMSARPPQLAILRQVAPARATGAILLASVAVLGALLVVIYGHGRATTAPEWIRALPSVNAALNATSAVFLVRAYASIRRRDVAAHARSMLKAVAASGTFLVSYIVYHSVHGDTKFTGRGAIRPVYFFVLISHVVLSAVVVPLIFLSLFFSLSGRFHPHKRLSVFTLPIWLYVSVTGVLVFVLLTAYG
jgi:putative membrane protein